MFTELYTKQLAGYASYHQDERNEATHFIGIPLIVIGVLFVASWPKLLGLASLSLYVFRGFCGPVDVDGPADWRHRRFARPAVSLAWSHLVRPDPLRDVEDHSGHRLCRL